MKGFILPVVATSLLLIVQTPDSRLEKFQHDAEVELHKSISITESDDLGMANGQTFCNTNPVQIKIRKSLDPETKQEVLAHELGHAFLCGRGLLIHTITTSETVNEGLADVVGSLGSGIESCYVDPLVDAEMAKRGFKTDKMAEAFVEKTNSHTKLEVHDWISRGDLYADATAVLLFCSELLYPSVPVEQFEGVFKDEPSVITRVEMLRHDLGKPTCSDTPSCIEAVKRLRDELKLKSYILVWNPKTNKVE